MKHGEVTLEAEERGRDRLVRAVYRDTSLWIVFGVALIAVLRADSIAPAFPSLTQTLHLSSKSVGLLITVFALPSVFLTPILGVVADRWGRKYVLVPSLVLFGLAGGACSLVRRFDLLLVLRFFQGVGAAPLSMLNITLIADLYDDDERTAAMGYNAALRSVGSTVFPILGGALATLGWYYPFALSLLAIPVALLVWLALKLPAPQDRQDLGQYLGQAWRSLQNWEIVGLFVAGCAVFITMFGAYLAYLPFLLKGTFGASSLVIGLMMSGRSIVNALIASQLGRLTRFFAESTLLKASFVLYALVFVAIPWVPNLWMMGILTFVLGTAEGLYWPSSQALLGALAPAKHRAGFMALNDTVLKLGQTLGPLLMGGVFDRWGTTGVFSTAATFSLATALLLTALTGHHGRRLADKKGASPS
jgi:predicted MFS family arabinose efflux permease